MKPHEREVLEKEERTLTQAIKSQIVFGFPVFLAIMIAGAFIGQTYFDASFGTVDIVALLIPLYLFDVIEDVRKLWRIRKNLGKT